MIRRGAIGALLLVATRQAGAFTLLGPYEPWMQVSNGFRLRLKLFLQLPDIAVRCVLSNEYRGNVPHRHIRI